MLDYKIKKRYNELSDETFLPTSEIAKNSG